MFHVKDSEFNPTGRQGFLSGMQPWLECPARDRSQGQTDSDATFAKFTEYDFDGWAAYEWGGCLEHPEDAAPAGAKYIFERIIHVTDKTFDDFAGHKDASTSARVTLGLD